MEPGLLKKKTFYENISKFSSQYPQLSPVTLKSAPKPPSQMLSEELSEMFRPTEGHRRGPQRGKKVVLVS